MTEIEQLIIKLKDFRDERDWAQFHNPKDLALALSIEASELLELYLWKNGKEIEDVDRNKVKEEVADVLSFTLLLCEKLNLNPIEIVNAKIEKNNEKYPIEKAKGTATKYTEL